MKKLFLFISLLLNQIIFAQSKIDSLENFKEIQEFVKTIRPDFKFVDLKNISSKSLDKLLNKENYAMHIIEQYEIDSNYYIRDFNNDGYKDLLIYGYEQGLNVMVIMNNAGIFKSYNLYQNDLRVESIFPKIKTNDNLITLYEIETIAHEQMTQQQKPVKHILTYRDSDFVEYNPNPKDYKIDSIIISMECPWWQPYRYYFKMDNASISGWTNVHTKHIQLTNTDRKQWAMIKSILNYAEFPKIHLPTYMIMDNITYKTTIFYNKGLSYTIIDNNGLANRSLQLVYKEIMPLKNKMDKILKKNKSRLPELK